jgi:hypothetical protein
MRYLRQSTPGLAWPSLRHARGRMLGLPFAATALLTGVVFGWPVCLAALMIAGVASFLVYVPLTALALNGGAPLPEEAPVPPLTTRAYATLLALWTATMWSAAGVVAALA